MKINSRVCNALLLMADISQHSRGAPVPLREVARRQGVSRLYLSQLAGPLRNASLLRSVWGNQGGYLLGRPAGEIRMLEIIRAVEGPVAIAGCLAKPERCAAAGRCVFVAMWQDINREVIRMLSHYTLADFLQRTGRGGGAARETGRRSATTSGIGIETTTARNEE